MTPLEKLDKLYAIKNKLHPLTLVLVVGFTETKKREMKPHDERFIETVYPIYFDAGHNDRTPSEEKYIHGED